MLNNLRQTGRSFLTSLAEGSWQRNPESTIFKRWLRGNRPPRFVAPPNDQERQEENSEENNHHGDRFAHEDDNRNVNHQQQQQEYSRTRQQQRRGAESHHYNYDSSENVITKPVERYQEFPDPRVQIPKKHQKNKYIKDMSEYGTVKNNSIAGDPFLSGPYPKTAARNTLRFEGGATAMEETTRRQIINPKDTSIILFPGQGSQYVGMSGSADQLPRYVQVLYEIASSILNVDLLDLCCNGPKEKLDQTIYCQPALLVSSLAALEKLRDEDPRKVEECVATAGFSVGEYAALVFSGVLTFEDAVRLVKVRAEAMQLASEITPSGMATVMYGADSKINYSLLVAREWCTREYNIENPVMCVANYLFPHCKVVAGHDEALQFIQLNYKDFKLRKVKRLPVSGAFHTDLMRPAAQPVKALISNITMNKPRMTVYSNVSGGRYRSSDDVRTLLPAQIYKPVLWEQVIHNIYKRPKETDYPMTYECGPGSSLRSVLKMVNAKAYEHASSVQATFSPNEAAVTESEKSRN